MLIIQINNFFCVFSRTKIYWIQTSKRTLFYVQRKLQKKCYCVVGGAACDAALLAIIYKQSGMNFANYPYDRAYLHWILWVPWNWRTLKNNCSLHQIDNECIRTSWNYSRPKPSHRKAVRDERLLWKVADNCLKLTTQWKLKENTADMKKKNHRMGHTNSAIQKTVTS